MSKIRSVNGHLILTNHVSRQPYFILHHWIPMEFKGIQLDLMEQVRAATNELGMGKFPGLVLIGGRDLNGGRRRKNVDK